MNIPTSAVLDQLENQLKELVKKIHQLQVLSSIIITSCHDELDTCYHKM